MTRPADTTHPLWSRAVHRHMLMTTADAERVPRMRDRPWSLRTSAAIQVTVYTIGWAIVLGLAWVLLGA